MTLRPVRSDAGTLTASLASPVSPGMSPGVSPSPATPPVAPAPPDRPTEPGRRVGHLRALGPARPVPPAKRALDLAVACAAVVVAAPVLVLLAVLVKATSRGPVLYRQTRIGHGGEPFTLVKFRSMRDGADREVVRLRALNEASGPLFKIRRDPRLTTVGRWMRRLSLDELPQLFNVIGGSMSLVGPRPALPEEVATFNRRELARHAVPPGLTGLAQVSGRSDLPWPAVVELDLHYVAHRSTWLDLKILARTLPAVLTGRGAY